MSTVNADGKGRRNDDSVRTSGMVTRRRPPIAPLIVLLLVAVIGCQSRSPAGAGTGPAPANVAAPTTTDGFAGSWLEQWPDIPEHATHVIARADGAYTISGSSPLTERYEISNVRLEGDVLKFSEGTASFIVEYELRVQDAQTLTVRALGTSGWRDDIVWTRIE